MCDFRISALMRLLSHSHCTKHGPRHFFFLGVFFSFFIHLRLIQSVDSNVSLFHPCRPAFDFRLKRINILLTLTERLMELVNLFFHCLCLSLCLFCLSFISCVTKSIWSLARIKPVFSHHSGRLNYSVHTQGLFDKTTELFQTLSFFLLSIMIF